MDVHLRHEADEDCGGKAVDAHVLHHLAGEGRGGGGYAVELFVGEGGAGAVENGGDGGVEAMPTLLLEVVWDPRLL
jgi:hypothetical protein